MKSFHSESPAALVGASGLAPLVIEASAMVMRRVRAELRKPGASALTFTQVRALACLQYTPGLSLSEVSEYLGIQAPTTSKSIEELVHEGLVRRETAVEDRRRVTLYATEAGKRALKLAAEPAQRQVAARLDLLSEADRDLVERAMELLLPLVRPAGRTGEQTDE